MISAYQRGNRDGLLNAAAELESRANAYDRQADRCRPGVDRGQPLAMIEFHRNLRDAHVHRDLALRLRSLSERLPDDPEDPEAAP